LLLLMHACRLSDPSFSLHPPVTPHSARCLPRSPASAKSCACCCLFFSSSWRCCARSESVSVRFSSFYPSRTPCVLIPQLLLPLTPTPPPPPSPGSTSELYLLGEKCYAVGVGIYSPFGTFALLAATFFAALAIDWVRAPAAALCLSASLLSCFFHSAGSCPYP